MKKELLKGIFILSGTIIGVGFFSLPFILSQIGILSMFFYFLFFGAVVILIHQFFGELCILTPDFKRMPGFARLYLGKWGERISLFSVILGFYGTLLAYLILGSNFLENLSGFGKLLSLSLYFLFGCFFIYFGIKTISKIEFLDVTLFSLILILIFVFGKNFINLSGFSNFGFTISNFFLPLGPIIFSLWGASIIPEVEEMLRGKKENLNKAIFLAILISAIFYFLFSILVFGICGKSTTEDAISGLKIFLPPTVIHFFFLFGLITTFTSFVALGLTLEKILWYDFKLKKDLAFLLTCFPPLFLFFLGFQRFLPVISFVGGVCLGIDGILILVMYYKKFQKQISKLRKFLIYVLSFILLTGIFSELNSFFK